MRYVVVFHCILCNKLYDEYRATSEKSLSAEFIKALSSAAIRQHTCIVSQDMLSEKEPTVFGAAIFAGIMTEAEWQKVQQVKEDAMMLEFGRMLANG